MQPSRERDRADIYRPSAQTVRTSVRKDSDAADSRRPSMMQIDTSRRLSKNGEPTRDAPLHHRQRDDDRSDNRRDVPDGGVRASVNHPNHSPVMSANSNGAQQQLMDQLSTTDPSMSASILSEAAYHYGKYLEANQNYQTAKAQKERHEGHFAAFPIMRERYEGGLLNAEQELQKTKDEWTTKTALMDIFIRSIGVERRPLPHEHASPKEMEDIAMKVSKDLIYRDLGTSSIEKYIEKIIGEKIRTTTNELTELRKDMNDYRAKDRQRSESLNKLAQSVTTVLAQQTALSTSIEQVKKSIATLEENVMHAEELAVKSSNASIATSKSMQEKLTSLDTRQIDELKGRVDQYEENVKKIKNEIDIFRSQRLQVQNNLDGAPPAAQFSDYATKDELDTARADNTKDVEGVLGVIEAECEKLRNAAQTTEKQLEQLMTQFSSIKENGKDLNGQLEATVNELKQEGHNTKGELAQVTKELDVVKTSTKDILAQLVDFRTSYMQKLEGKISTDVVHLAKNSAEHEARLEGLAMAVQHCDERLSQWSTKDYYDKVVNRLSQLNPNWFATCTKVTQLSDQVAGLNVKLASMSQSFTTNFSSVSKTVQLLKDHQEKINITAAIPPIVPSNVNGHPPGSFDEISEKLEFFKSEIKDLNARLEADTNMHDKHANDLQEWAGLVEVKVREAIETVARLEDEIRAMQSGELRNHGPAPETGLEPETEPGHHLQPGHQVQIGIEDRWKAVSVSTSAREEPRTSQDLDL